MYDPFGSAIIRFCGAGAPPSIIIQELHMALTFELNDDTGLFEATDSKGNHFKQFSKSKYYCILADGREAYGSTAFEARHRAEAAPIMVKFALTGKHAIAIARVARNEEKTPSKLIEDLVHVMLERRGTFDPDMVSA